MGNLHIDITGDNANFVRALNESQSKVAEMSSKLQNEGEKMGDVFGKLGKMAAATFAGVSVKGFLDKLVQVRGMFQDIEASMSVFLGSAEKAEKFVKELNDYAWYNMFEFEDLAKQSSQLLAFGNNVDDVIPILDKLSNVAAGTKVPLEEMVALYNRAKNLGSVDSKGMQSWAAKGIVINDIMMEMGAKTKVTSVTFEELDEVLNHVTAEGGRFHDLMASQLNNLTASTGQLADDITNMYNEIGKATEGYMKNAIDFADLLVANYETLGKAIASLISTYGAYRAALVANTAIETIHIFGLKDGIKYIGLMTKGTKAFAVAQALVNAVAAVNPYVLLASALVGATTAFILFHKSADASADEAERVAKAQKKATDASEDRRQSIERLIRTIDDENASEFQHRLALDNLKNLMPEVFSKYETEKQMIADLTKVRKAYNEELERESANKNQELYDNELERANDFSFIASSIGSKDRNVIARREALYKKYADEYETARRTMNIGGYFASLASASRTQAGVQGQAMASARTAREGASLASMSVDQLRAYIDGLEEYRKAADSAGGSIFFAGDKFETTTDEIEKRINAAKSRLIDATERADEDYIKEARKSYYKAVDERERIVNSRKDKSLYPTEEAYIKAIEKADANIKSAKDYLESLGGDTKNDSAKEIADFKAERERVAKEKQRVIEDVELSIRQETNNALADSAEKEREQYEIDFQRKKLEIDRYYDDLIDDRVAQEKKLWESNPANRKAIERGAVFDPSSVDRSLSVKEQEEMNAKLLANEAERARKIEQLERRENQYRLDFLKEYGTLEEKVGAIQEEYAQRIAESTNEYEKSGLIRKMEEDINDINFEELKKSINWEYIFGDLEHVDTSTLEVVNDQLKQFMATAKNLTPEQIKTVTDAMLNLQEKMDLSNPIETIRTARKEYALAKAEYDKYASDLRNAQDAGDESAERKATLGMTNASQKMTRALNKEDDAFNAVTDVVGQYSDALSHAGDVIGGATGECLKLAASAISAGKGMANGIKAFGNAVSAIEKSVAILAIIEAALKVIMFITDVFSSKADQTLVKYVDTMDNYIKLLSDDISELNDAMSDTQNTMSETIAYYKELIDMSKRYSDAIKSQSYTWLNSGSSGGFLGIGSSSSEGRKIVKEMAEMLNSSDAEVRAFYRKGASQLNEYYNKVYGTYARVVDDFGRLDWIWRLSDEDLIALSKDIDALSMLGDTLSDAIKTYADSIEDATDALNDQFAALLDVSFDDFYGDFRDMISDMDKDTSDFADDFSEKMYKALVKDMVAGKFKGNLKKLYETAGNMAEEGTLADNIDMLRSEYEAYARSAREESEAIREITGYTDSFSQEATAKGFQTMSHDDASELNGRFTAMQISNETINQNVSAILGHLASLALAASASGSAVEEIRDMMVMANAHLEDIARYTKTAAGFGEMLTQIVEHTNRL